MPVERYGLLCPTCWKFVVLPRGNKDAAIDAFATEHAGHLKDADLIQIIDEKDFPKFARLALFRGATEWAVN